MSSRSLRYEAGGDPTQGPVRELAADPPTPDRSNDFPDAPTASSGPVQDRPDPDRFAERIGLRPEDVDEVRPVRRGLGGLAASAVVRSAARTLGTAALACRVAGAGLDRLAHAIAGTSPDDA